MISRQKTVVLIACTSRKRKVKSKAEDLYSASQLFRLSLSYARSLKPDNIFILSALHHLVDLDQQIEPYNVTLSNIPPCKRSGVKVLNREEKTAWGNIVLSMLSNQANIANDHFIILAGKEYVKPLVSGIKNLENRFEGMNLFQRMKFLKNSGK